MKAKTDDNGKRIQNVAQVYHGTEPKWLAVYAGKALTSQIGAAINWYSVSYDNSDFKSWVLKHFKTNGWDTNFNDDVCEPDFRGLGMLLRIKEKGCTFDEPWQARLENEIKKLRVRVKAKPKLEIVEKSKYEKIQATMKLRTSKTLAVVEELLDQIFLGTVKITEKTTWESLKIVIPAAYMADVSNRLDGHLAELEEVLDAIDAKTKTPEQEFLIEGYSNFTKTKLVVYINSLQVLQNLCDSAAKKVEAVKIAEKKPKAEKPVDLGKMVEFFNYQKNLKNPDVVSPNPKKIIGADQVIVYNSEKRIISFLKGGSDGLSIKSTTITGIDEKQSFRKNVRKPEVLIPALLAASKPQAKHLVKELVAKEQEVTGRMNNETVIIRID